MYNLNMDYKGRDKIIFGSEIDWKNQTGTAKRFSISFSQLKDLIHNDYIDLSHNTNESPTFEIFYKFLCKYPQLNVNGWAKSPYRRDYSVSIYGIEGNIEQWNEDLKKQLKEDLKAIFKNADEFIVSEKEVWVWYD